MRHVNRVLAALLGLALIVLAALLIIEVVSYRAAGKSAIVHWRSAYSWAGRTTWKQGSVRVACVLLVVAGVVLLIAELKRAKVSRLAADPDATDATGSIDTAYTRRGVATAVRSAVLDVDGVRATSVKVNRRKVTVAATSSARQKAAAHELTEPVTTAARSRIDALGLRSTLSVSARVQPRSA